MAMSADLAGFLVSFFSLTGLLGSLLIAGTIIHEKMYKEFRIYYLLLSLASADAIGCALDFVIGVGIIIQSAPFPFNTPLANAMLGALHTHVIWADIWSLTIITTIQAISLKKYSFIDIYLTPKVCMSLISVIWLVLASSVSVMLIPGIGIATSTLVPENYSMVLSKSTFMLGYLAILGSTTTLYCIVVDCIIVYLVYKAVHATDQGDNLKEVRVLAVQFVITNGVIVLRYISAIPVGFGWIMRDLNVAFLFTVSTPLIFGINYYIYMTCNPTFRQAGLKFLKFLFCAKQPQPNSIPIAPVAASNTANTARSRLRSFRVQHESAINVIEL